MGFILRQRPDVPDEDEGRFASADDEVRRLEVAIGVATDLGDDGDDVWRRTVARLQDLARASRSRLNDARWRYRKGDVLSAYESLDKVVTDAQRGRRLVDEHLERPR
jgi:hypothetical protein